MFSLTRVTCYIFIAKIPEHKRKPWQAPWPPSHAHHAPQVTAILWPVVLIISTAASENIHDTGFSLQKQVPPGRQQSLRVGVLATWAQPECLSFQLLQQIPGMDTYSQFHHPDPTTMGFRCTPSLHDKRHCNKSPPVRSLCMGISNKGGSGDAGSEGITLGNCGTFIVCFFSYGRLQSRVAPTALGARGAQ